MLNFLSEESGGGLDLLTVAEHNLRQKKSVAEVQQVHQAAVLACF